VKNDNEHTALPHMQSTLNCMIKGKVQTLDWTTPLDYWTGLLRWTTGLTFFGFQFHFLHSLVQGGVILLNTNAFHQKGVLFQTR